MSLVDFSTHTVDICLASLLSGKLSHEQTCQNKAAGSPPSSSLGGWGLGWQNDMTVRQAGGGGGVGGEEGLFGHFHCTRMQRATTSSFALHTADCHDALLPALHARVRAATRLPLAVQRPYQDVRTVDAFIRRAGGGARLRHGRKRRGTRAAPARPV